MAEMKHYNNLLDRLKAVSNWLCRCYMITGQNGFSAGFDLRRGWLGPYSETTGYIIPTFYRLSIITGKKKYSDIATAAASWLISIQEANGSIIDFVGPCRKIKKRPPVVFNTGQDLFGLIAAYRWTGKKIYLNSAYEAAKWITVQKNDAGLWHDESSFGAQSYSTYYTHVTWPLYLVGLETTDKMIIDAAVKGLDYVVGKTQKNYSVDCWGFSEQQPDYTHTIAYTIEGMLEQGLLMGGRSSQQFVIAKKITYTLLANYKKQGKLAGSYDSHWKGDYSYMCTPGHCQVAILFMRLYTIEGDKEMLRAGFEILDKVLSKQFICKVIPSCVRGTVAASWPPVIGKYMRWLYPNWAAKYLADLLMLTIYLKSSDKSNTHYLKDIARFPG